MIRTLSARLTLQLSLIFALLTLVAFTLSYINLKIILLEKTDANITIDAFEIAKTLQTGGLSEAIREIGLEAEAEGINRIFIRLFSPEREVLVTSNLSAWPELKIKPQEPKTEDRRDFTTLLLEGMRHKTRILTQDIGGGYLLQIGFLLKEDTSLLVGFRQGFATVFVALVIMGALSSFLISKRAMRGVERIRHIANRVSQGDFSHRVVLGNDGEEIENLARTFNQMQEKIQVLIHELQDVTNNIAHDLRSPLTRIRGLVETTLTGKQNIAEYQEMAGSVIEECDKLTGMVNTMLEIAETDAGIRTMPKTSVNMAEITRDVGQLFYTVAEDKGLDIQIMVAADPLEVRGDRSRLQRAVANLVDNAIKYTPSGGEVKIYAQANETHILISVADTGPGIPAEETEHIFNRFCRLDQSRSTPGCGLGLSLARTLIRAHGGDIHIESQLGHGSTFTISLPRQAV